MDANDLAKIVVNTAYDIHYLYGPGLFESVYEELLCYELRKENLDIKRQVAIPLIHEDIKMEVAFRADIIVNSMLLIELKSVDNLAPIHHKQVLTYLKLTNLELGLLINFNVRFIKEGIKKIANGIKDPMQS